MSIDLLEPNLSVEALQNMLSGKSGSEAHTTFSGSPATLFYEPISRSPFMFDKRHVSTLLKFAAASELCSQRTLVRSLPRSWPLAPCSLPALVSMKQPKLLKHFQTFLMTHLLVLWNVGRLFLIGNTELEVDEACVTYSTSTVRWVVR